MANKVYDIVTERILELLDKGIVPWNRPWSYKNGNGPTSMRNQYTHYNLVTKKPYRGINPWILSATAEERGYQSHYWLSFKQTKDEGGSVKAGEKSTLVVFWKFMVRDAIDAEGKVIVDENGIAKKKTVPMLRYYLVFNVEQCEGIKIPEEAEKVEPIIPDQSDTTPIEACEHIMSLYKSCPVIHHGSNRAYYSPMSDTITIPDKDQFKDMAHYYSVLFHESAHSTGHESRLRRSNFLSFFGSENYGKEELVAEMTAAFLCATAGIENTTIETNASYIASWKKTIKADTKMVVIAAAQAQKAADFMMGIYHEDNKADMNSAE